MVFPDTKHGTWAWTVHCYEVCRNHRTSERTLTFPTSRQEEQALDQFNTGSGITEFPSQGVERNYGPWPTNSSTHRRPLPERRVSFEVYLVYLTHNIPSLPYGMNWEPEESVVNVLSPLSRYAPVPASEVISIMGNGTPRHLQPSWGQFFSYQYPRCCGF